MSAASFTGVRASDDRLLKRSARILSMTAGWARGEISARILARRAYAQPVIGDDDWAG